jgi:hypothetical protein
VTRKSLYTINQPPAWPIWSARLARPTIVGMILLNTTCSILPSTDGPTPPVDSLVISFRDLLLRTQAFLIGPSRKTWPIRRAFIA